MRKRAQRMGNFIQHDRNDDVGDGDDDNVDNDVLLMKVVAFWWRCRGARWAITSEIRARFTLTPSRTYTQTRTVRLQSSANDINCQRPNFCVSVLLVRNCNAYIRIMNNPAGADASLMLLLFVFVGAAVDGVVVVLLKIRRCVCFAVLCCWHRFFGYDCALKMMCLWCGLFSNLFLQCIDICFNFNVGFCHSQLSLCLVVCKICVVLVVNSHHTERHIHSLAFAFFSRGCSFLWPFLRIQMCSFLMPLLLHF